MSRVRDPQTKERLNWSNWERPARFSTDSLAHAWLAATWACCLVVGLGAMIGCGSKGPDGSGGVAGGFAGGSVSNFADCVYPSTDDRCECYPFGNFPTEGPSCGPGEGCALRFLEDVNARPGRFPQFDLPALDGGDGTKTSECVAAVAQPDLLGEPCSVSAESIGVTLVARRDTCGANLFCAPRGVCVAYCWLQDDCFPRACTVIAYGPEAPIGICSEGVGGQSGAGGFGGSAGGGGQGGD